MVCDSLSQIAKAVPSPMEREQLVSAITQNPLGTPEHIAAFVVNRLFNAIVGLAFAQDTSVTTVSEKMIIWFKAYR